MNYTVKRYNFLTLLIVLILVVVTLVEAGVVGIHIGMNLLHGSFSDAEKEILSSATQFVCFLTKEIHHTDRLLPQLGEYTQSDSVLILEMHARRKNHVVGTRYVIYSCETETSDVRRIVFNEQRQLMYEQHLAYKMWKMKFSYDGGLLTIDFQFCGKPPDAEIMFKEEILISLHDKR